MSLRRGSAVAHLAVGVALCAIVTVPVRAQQQIPIGTSISGQLTASDPTMGDGSHYKLFTFQGMAGQTVQIDLQSSDFDSYLYLKDASGTTIAHDDDSGGGLNSRITYTLPSGGMYQIVVNTLRQGQFGSFTLQLQSSGTQVASLSTASQQIPMNSSVTGTLTASDPTLSDGSHYKLFTFQGTAGQAVQIDLMSTAFDSYLSLRDQSGTSIAHDDDGGEGLNSRILFTLPYTGTYQIVANTLRSGQFGDFTLQLRSAVATQPTITSIQPAPSALSLPTVGQIGLNQQVQNTLMGGGTTWDGKPIHLYTLNCSAGQGLQLDVLSSWDNYALIFDPSGNQVASNDDGGEGLNARIRYTCPTSGTYRLGVTTFSSSTTTGPYTMQVQATSTQPVPTQPTVQPLNPQPTVQPLNQPTPQAAPSANVIPGPGQVGQIAVGQSKQGRLEPGDQMMGSDSTYADIWQFQGAAGQNVAIELRSSDFATYVQLLDPSGKVLAESAGHPNSGLAFTLPNNATYQIVVNNNGTQRQTGTYTLSVR
jgi:hypothetical protein